MPTIHTSCLNNPSVKQEPHRAKALKNASFDHWRWYVVLDKMHWVEMVPIPASSLIESSKT